MANPTQEHEDLLRRHRFALVSQNKHRKYKDPEGRVYIVSKTPSDWWAWRNALTTLKRVIANPVPTSEVIEVERQRRELEATITLTMRVRPMAGVVGKGKGKTQRGVGIYYEEKIEPTVEELARREELRQRALANQGRKYEEWRKRREERRKREEWARQLSKFRRASRQVTKDVSDIYGFMQLMTLLGASRSMAAGMLRENGNEVKTAEQRGRLLDAIFVLNHAKAYGDECDEQFQTAVAKAASTDVSIGGQFLMYRGGRAPHWFPALNETINIDAQRLRLLRRTLAWLTRGQVEGAEAILTLKSAPDWLARAIGILQVGVNRIEDAQ
jgi:hypothetical protein